MGNHNEMICPYSNTHFAHIPEKLSEGDSRAKCPVCSVVRKLRPIKSGFTFPKHIKKDVFNAHTSK